MALAKRSVPKDEEDKAVCRKLQKRLDGKRCLQTVRAMVELKEGCNHMTW